MNWYSMLPSRGRADGKFLTRRLLPARGNYGRAGQHHQRHRLFLLPAGPRRGWFGVDCHGRGHAPYPRAPHEGQEQGQRLDHDELRDAEAARDQSRTLPISGLPGLEVGGGSVRAALVAAEGWGRRRNAGQTPPPHCQRIAPSRAETGPRNRRPPNAHRWLRPRPPRPRASPVAVTPTIAAGMRRQRRPARCRPPWPVTLPHRASALPHRADSSSIAER
ncbi:unnamed protein product, partial [Urochloa humidicola]